MEGHYPFIILSFVIRIVEALGNAAFLTASFAIIAKEFPDNVATTFASLETFFGLGLIVGPTVGGALYQVRGYNILFPLSCERKNGLLLICYNGTSNNILYYKYVKSVIQDLTPLA